MKTIALILLLSFCGCVGMRPIHQGGLYITRKYCGDFDTLITGKKESIVRTSDAYFYIPAKVILNIPKDTRCYIRYIPELLSGTSNSVWILYFTWDGTEDLYMIKQNFITGRIK